MNKRSTIINPLFCDDTEATIDTWKKLGATFTPSNTNRLIINGFCGKPQLPKEINVRESGTLLRFLLSAAGLGTGKLIISGQGTLLERCNSMVVEPLRKLGMEIEAENESYRLPITVHAKGKIKGGTIDVRGDQSSQIVSSLLIVAPLAKEDVKIQVKGKIVSKPYIDITIDVLEKSGIHVERDGYKTFVIKQGQSFEPLDNYVIHGDYSSAAFLMAAACLVESDVVIRDLVRDKQGDQKIIDILRDMGANITRSDDSVRIRGPYELCGIEVNCCDIPDLVPVIASLAVFAKGRTRIYDIAHIRHKESDRISSLAEEFAKLGVDVQSTRDEIIIRGSLPTHGEVLSHRDHRIAMALTLLGLKTEGLVIRDADCISKSYHNFVQDMKNLGANLGEG